MKLREHSQFIGFACFPVLYVYGANQAVIPLRDLALGLLISVLLSLVILFLLSKMTRHSARVAVILSILLVVFFSFPSIAVVSKKTPLIGDVLVPSTAKWVLWGVLMLGLGGLAAKLSKYEQTKSFMNLASIALVALGLLPAAQSLLSPVATTAARDNRSFGASAAGKPRPDIFYILLDGYGRSDVLEEKFGFSDRQHLEQLRKMGFFVGEQSHSNYVQTQLSLASTLNFDYLEGVLSQEALSTTDRGFVNRAIDESRVSGILKDLGYSNVAVGTGFPEFSFNSFDLYFEDGGKSQALPAKLMELTPLATRRSHRQGSAEIKRRAVRSALDRVREMSRPATRPRFAVVHLLVPHPPFVFNADGSPRTPSITGGLWDGSHFTAIGGTREEYLEGYRNQAQFIMSQIVSLCAEIVRVNPQSVIILQGDHGSKLELDQGSLANTDVREAFSILNAIRLPGVSAEALYPEITSVNTFRVVLRHLFGADLPPLADKSFYSTWEDPYRFIEVTSRLQGN